MPLVVRCLLAWCLVLALPVQGWAAAWMTPCGHEAHPGGHSATVPMPQALAAALHPAAKGAPPALDCAQHHHMAPGCHPCASCCSIAAALPAASPMLLPLEASVPVPADAPPPRSALFLTGGPERPPRRPHA